MPLRMRLNTPLVAHGTLLRVGVIRSLLNWGVITGFVLPKNVLVCAEMIGIVFIIICAMQNTMTPLLLESHR